MFSFPASQHQHPAESLVYISLDLAQWNMLFVSNKWHISLEFVLEPPCWREYIEYDKWRNYSVSLLLICCSVVKQPLDSVYMCTGSDVERADEMRYSESVCILFANSSRRAFLEMIGGSCQINELSHKGVITHKTAVTWGQSRWFNNCWPFFALCKILSTSCILTINPT